MNRVEDRLHRSGLPAISERLRRRVLATAAHELERIPQRSVVDAVYASRPVRWAWAAACAALLTGNLIVAGGGSVDAGRAVPAPQIEDAVIADAVSLAAPIQRPVTGREDRELARRQLVEDPLLGTLGS